MKSHGNEFLPEVPQAFDSFLGFESVVFNKGIQEGKQGIKTDRNQSITAHIPSSADELHGWPWPGILASLSRELFSIGID